MPATAPDNSGKTGPRFSPIGDSEIRDQAPLVQPVPPELLQCGVQVLGRRALIRRPNHFRNEDATFTVHTDAVGGIEIPRLPAIWSADPALFHASRVENAHTSPLST